MGVCALAVWELALAVGYAAGCVRWAGCACVGWLGSWYVGTHVCLYRRGLVGVRRRGVAAAAVCMRSCVRAYGYTLYAGLMRKWRLMALMVWPPARRCLAKFAISIQKFSLLFCFRKCRKLPTINPLKQLVGWAKIGSIYKFFYCPVIFIYLYLNLCELLL